MPRNFFYEKVSLYTPNRSQKRPIVLIGPKNLGVFELRKMLIQNDDRLAVAVPHTTRRKMLEEIDGRLTRFSNQIIDKINLIGSSDLMTVSPSRLRLSFLHHR